MVGVSGGVMAGWLESSPVLDCKGGQLVLLTRDQYCPPSGWSQAAGSDRGPSGVIGSGGPASRLPTPPSVLSQLSHVIPQRRCHPRRLGSLSHSSFSLRPCKCPLSRWMRAILGPFFMLLCKSKIYVIWEFHGNKVAIYSELENWNLL